MDLGPPSKLHHPTILVHALMMELSRNILEKTSQPRQLQSRRKIIDANLRYNTFPYRKWVQFILKSASQAFTDAKIQSSYTTGVLSGHQWPGLPRMAIVGRCHLSLCHHWHRPEADIGGVHCMTRREGKGCGVIWLKRGLRVGNYRGVYEISVVRERLR